MSGAVSAQLAFELAARLLLTAALSFAAVSPRSEHPPEHPPVTWSLKLAKTNQPVNPGAAVEVLLTAEIAADWHLYSLTQPPDGPAPLQITLARPDTFKLLPSIKGPPPFREYDPNFDAEAHFYARSATFSLPIVVATNAAAGKHRLIIQAIYQACSERSCLPPTTAQAELLLIIEPKAPARGGPPAEPSHQPSKPALGGAKTKPEQ